MSGEIEAALESIDRYAATLEAESTRYWRLHRERFAWFARLLTDLRISEGLREEDRSDILDIGNSYQTLLFSRLFPSSRVDTLGFFDHRFGLDGASSHIEYDLNRVANGSGWPQSARTYRIITFMEVIEHLHVSPLQVLLFLRGLLADDGLLVVQTPNAAALKKRIKLLVGRHPYELLRTNPYNPGHYREYTVQELKRYAGLTGFSVESVFRNTFLIDGKRLDRVCDRVSRGLPGFLKGTITVTLRKTGVPRIQEMDRLPLV